MEFELVKQMPLNKLSEYEKHDLQLIQEIEDEYKLQKTRDNQTLFRNKLIEKFKNKCIISNSIEIECDSAHIIPVQNYGNYEINNGLLLCTNLHRTFDMFLWSINPITFEIQISKKHDSGTIKIYDKNCLINKLDKSYENNLMWHYNRFLESEKI
jgi:predicted restriction endonuclease